MELIITAWTEQELSYFLRMKLETCDQMTIYDGNASNLNWHDRTLKASLWV